MSRTRLGWALITASYLAGGLMFTWLIITWGLELSRRI